MPAPTHRLTPPAPPSRVAALARAHGVQPLVAHLLHHAGVTPEDTLTPELTLAPLPNLEAAAERIAETIKGRGGILLHGDYDADGITGAAILKNGLEDLGARVKAFLPDRLNDGYGLNIARVPQLARDTDLLVTVDCGVTAIDEVAAYRETGVEVIVTDHHQPKERLPEALIVHPTALGSNENDPLDLTGAGVAYHLLWAVRRHLGLDEAPLDLAPLAAIGTIADVATLTKHNRALIQEGLARLKTTSNPGVRALAADLGGEVTSADIGYRVAPRLNAAGRLGEADTALELLTTRSEHRARALAAYLAALNEHRKALQAAVTTSALAKAEADAPAIVLEDDTWHPGVIGIAAAKIVERLGKPAFLSSGGKGSVRVPDGGDALAHLQHANSALTAYGGHKQAAGYTLDVNRFQEFKALIHEHARANPAPARIERIDHVLHPDSVTMALLDELRILEPHGPGNPRPRLALIAPLHSTRVIGKDQTHLMVKLAHDGPANRGVAWGRADLHGALVPGRAILVTADLNVNEFNGEKSIEFTAQHLAPHQPLPTTGDAANGPRVTRATDTPAVTVAGHVIVDEATSRETRETTVIAWLPDDPHRAVALLAHAHASSRHVHYALNPTTIARLEEGARRLLTRETLRRHMASLAKTGASPRHRDTEKCQAALRELDLLDPRGFLKREQRNPYASDTLLTDEITRYVIHNLVQAYRYAAAAAFEQATNTLLLDAHLRTAAAAQAAA